MVLYHFIGIKGSGMSPLAQILHDMNFKVQGSDVENYIFTQQGLDEREIPILKFNKKNIKPGQIIIVGNSFSANHEEVAMAKQLNLPIFYYHEFLGNFIKEFPNISIGVTGTHGKTSTTGLLSHVLQQFKRTSYLIGDGSGKGVELSDYFCFEACEYRRHFLSYNPSYAIITNIDFDHPDYFEDINDVFNAFQSMSLNVEKAIVACGDDLNNRKLKAHVPIMYYGTSDDNEYMASNINIGEGYTNFDVFVKGNFYSTFSINGFGLHSVLNALAVITVCHQEKIPLNTLKEGLKTFQGVKRRFSEYKFDKQILIDDYAHHPTEIKATIQAAKQKYPEKEIVAIFQPHTFTRTKKFLSDFSTSLGLADSVYICDIFKSAREGDELVTTRDIVTKITNSKIIDFNNIDILKKHYDSVLLFMGAGDIQKYQNLYKEKVTQ